MKLKRINSIEILADTEGFRFHSMSLVNLK